jgi:hypothetical protein
LVLLKRCLFFLADRLVSSDQQQEGRAHLELALAALAASILSAFASTRVLGCLAHPSDYSYRHSKA